MEKMQKTYRQNKASQNHGLPRVISENEEENQKLEDLEITQKQFKRIANLIQKSSRELRRKNRLLELEENYKQTNINNIYDN